jgi:diguanylate cyclase (GGDEF)-like protein/PAS domain S-box-containing protein
LKLTTDSPPQRALVQYGPRAVAYMLAIALPIITVVLRLQWFPLQYGPWLVVFMLPISFCAAIGGFGPGLVATLLSSMLADYLLFPPTGSLLLNKPENALYLTVFALVALWTCLLSHRARAANRLRLRDQDNLSLLAQLIDSTDNSVVATSLTGIISHWNTGAERIFGYTADQALGQSILMLFPPLAHASEQSIQARIAQGEKIPAYEARCKHRSGHSVEITTTVSAILNTHGNIIGISHISGDITQHKQLEQAKKQAEAKFRALVEQSLTGVYIIQDEGIVYANQAFADIFDYPEPQQLIGRQAIEIVAAEDRVTVVGNILRRLNGLQTTLSYRFNAICRGGERIVVEVHGRHFMHEGRSAIIGSIMDVTEAQHLQEEMTRLVTEKTTLLQQRERELNTILDNMPGMISYYDPQLRHRFGNRMYCDWHDIQATQLENLQLNQLINPKMYAALLPRLQATLQGNTHIFELTMESRSGKPGWDAQVHLIPNRHDGQVRGLFALVLDISPIKSAERSMRESEARFRQLFETAPVGIALYHQDGSCVMANLAQANLIGTTREQLLTQNFYQLVSWQHSGLLHIALKTLQTGQPQRYECKVTTTFGKQLEIDCEFTLPEVEGTRYLMMLSKDISPYRQAAQLMKQAMDAELDKNRIDLQYRQVIENMADGFFACDREGRLLEVNDVYARLSGYSRSELLSMQISDLSIAESSAEISKRLLRIATHGNARFETLQRHKNGSAWPSDISTSFSPADGGKIYAFVRDITEMKRAEDEIRRLAFYDSLTHLPNRQLLLDRLSQALVLCQRNRRYGALLFIDLDNFKLLNDTLGHDMGDHLLVAVAERLKTCVRAKDTVARLGGDEFIIMLEGLDNQRANAAIQIRAIASTVMEALNRPYQLQQTEYHNTPSIGVALFCEQETTVEELLKQADLAMYQAKAAGRNTLCFFDPVTQTAVENRTALETELRNALRQDHLILHYQPQIDRHGNTIGAEALVRWQHPEQGLIAPGEFISLAEESGLVYPLGLRVLELACQQLAYWQTQPALAQLSLAVNVSARQFRHRDFVVQIRDLVTLYQVDPRNLKLELTESLLLHDVEESARKMDTLRTMGVKFSLDDFGTGYSSLAYLKALPLEQLKIDQSFVRDILSDPNDAAIVRAIIVMGHSLGLTIVAEGVETAEQWQFLMHEGCDIGQGYYFSPAVTGLDFEALELEPHFPQSHRQSNHPVNISN